MIDTTHRRKRLNNNSKITIFNMASISNSVLLQIGFYLILFIITTSMIIKTASNYPIFPFQTTSLEWNNSWLIATVIDYYGACLCYCGIILGTENNIMHGILWSCGCCLLGSPICCLWILIRLWKYGSSGICIQNTASHSLNSPNDIITESSHLS